MKSRLMYTSLMIALVIGGGLMANPLRQDLGADGIVSIEAENYDANVEVGGHAWEETGPVDGFTGVLGMHAPNGRGGHSSNYAANSERLEYEINFVKTGPHYVWILAWAASGSDDSCHAGLDGEETPLSDNLSGWNGNYEWNNGRYQRPERAEINISSTGVHTLNIWVREDGLIIDKIVLTTNPDYTPEGDGPPESSRGVRINASAMTPGPGADDVLRDSVLVWAPGIYAAQHDLYFGDSFDDVNVATVPTAAALDVNAFDPGRLEFGQTYYWRVDEINAAPDRTVFTGDLWSFTVEPYSIPVPGSTIVATASSSSNELSIPETTVNGDGMEADNVHAISAEAMWFSESPDLNPWIQYEFEDVIKLDMMKVWNSNSAAESAIGWGIKDVQIEYSVDRENWDVLEDATQLSRAPGSPTYSQFDEIAFNGAAAKIVRFNILSNWGGVLPSYSLSEVQFSMIPEAARTPGPASGSANMQPDAVVTWRSGRAAAQHTVYVSADQNEVAHGLAPSVSSPTNSIDLSVFGLTMGETYYWRVDEVNEAEAVSVWAGPVWSLSMVGSLTVDDFENYSNVSPDRPFQTWVDGFGYSADEFFPAGYGGNGTGAGIGHDIWSLSSPHYDGELMETSNAIAGSNTSLPFYYSNSGGVASETQRTFAVPQDWTLGGAQTLSIAFSGQAGNTGTLYVKINNTKVTYQLDAGNIAIGAWQVWNIDLTQIASNLSSVSTMAIGVDGAGASGMILIDDMKLYAQPGELITPVPPGSAGLLAQYSFEGNANDSSGNGLNGQMQDSQLVSPGAMNQGSAVQIALGGYVDLGNPTSLDFGTGDWTVAAWFKTGMTGTGDANKGTIFGKGGDSGGGHRVALIMSETSEGVVTLVCDDDATKIVVNSNSLTNDDRWHFVAGQRQGTEIRIFIDGQLEATGTADAAYDLSGTSQHNAYIGAVTNNGSATLYKLLDGSVDEVAIYNRALSAEELFWLAGRQLPIEKPF